MSARQGSLSPTHAAHRAGGGPARISCERCRRRKVKCDRARPCTQCISVNVECINVDSMKKRPISRSYAAALEEQVASLEVFIASLTSASHVERDQMLANFQQSSVDHLQPLSESDISRRGLVKGSLLRMKQRRSSQFFGETSYYPIIPCVDEEMDEDLRPSLWNSELEIQQSTTSAEQSPEGVSDVLALGQLNPQNGVCQQAMSAFFQHAYYYHMVLYREYFLRDYKAGKGPYYSDLLFYAIAALGSHLSSDDRVQNLSDTFYDCAENILHSGVLDSPDVTTVQALLLLGQRDVGHGKTTKGWLLTGLAFRMVHEMGLHLDPNHWKTTHDSEVDREALRRVYWACFIADKQLSLYLGRPPCLHSTEADVNDSVRIAYPVDWDSLLDEYIEKNTSRTQYEDGVAFTSCFTQLANLSKIVHRMITEVFEYRKTNDATILATSTKSIYVALNKWLSELPPKLHWNQWLKNTVPPYVLHLHIYYHTALIILYRPPRTLMTTHLAIFRQGFEICEQSLALILQLLKVYSRDYGFDHLPLAFIHPAATITSLVLLKLYVPGLSGEQNGTAQQLEQISAFVDTLAKTWTAALPIQTAIKGAQQKGAQTGTLHEPITFDWENMMTLDWHIDPGVEAAFNLSPAGSSGLIANEQAIIAPYEQYFQQTM
ncbi:fungal-specific transcription factor domain-containing protein [Aspergillus pseudoustus]|uniref:Fungal-specific transcription factor domain-containing protein n=1 Tax=Aspergillus pseudoustus TaxID=1810923 RepID=A0ABR4IPK5_9EURO